MPIKKRLSPFNVFLILLGLWIGNYLLIKILHLKVELNRFPPAVILSLVIVRGWRQSADNEALYEVAINLQEEIKKLPRQEKVGG